MADDPSCYYFGCWGRAGHYLHDPSGHTQHRAGLEFYESGDGRLQHIDGTLAPRRSSSGKLCWGEQERYSEECPQGEFLIHHLSTGYTAMAWWDRNQGDERGACNSVLLLKGEHSAAEMLAALEQHFPRVLDNLRTADVQLVDATPTRSVKMERP